MQPAGTAGDGKAGAGLPGAAGKGQSRTRTRVPRPSILPTLRIPLMRPLRKEAMHRSGGSMRGDIDCGFVLLTDALSVQIKLCH